MRIAVVLQDVVLVVRRARREINEVTFGPLGPGEND